MRKPLPALLAAFTAEVQIIGVNPCVLLPAATLKKLFEQAGREKGTIPVRGSLDGHPFKQTLVKFSGKWRLYLNTPMRKACGKEVGDAVAVRVAFDPVERRTPMPALFEAALQKDPDAKTKFMNLTPSRQKEIVRYIAGLKSEAAVRRNIERAIGFLMKKDRFVRRKRA